MNSIVFSESILKYSSASMKIGAAPLYEIAFTGAMKVRVGTITSSPGLTPTNLKLT